MEGNWVPGDVGVLPGALNYLSLNFMLQEKNI